MKYHNLKTTVFILSVLCLGLVSCSGSSGGSDDVSRVNDGSWFVSGNRWPHDGEPFESENFTIFSDAASQEARLELAQLAEDIFDEIKQLFEIENNDVFLYPPGQDKMHIYTYKNYFPKDWGGWAYYGGLLIYSLDHLGRQEFGHTEPDIYIATLTHELMHVVESLLKGSGNPDMVDVWLTEGLAEVVSGGTAGGSIKDLDTMDALSERYGSRNPIQMHQYDYPPIEGIIFYYYYPMFQLAVEYLVDIAGHDKSFIDLKNLFLDVSVGVEFETAFEERLEIGLQEYEREFLGLMNDYRL